MKKILFALALGIIGAPAAQAGCTAPVGRYVGSGAGLTLDSTGSVVGGATHMITLRIPAGGIWKAKMWYVDEISNSVDVYTVPAIGTPDNSFNSNTCKGLATLATGNTVNYVVSNRGKVIEMAPWTSATPGFIWVGIITLKKL